MNVYNDPEKFGLEIAYEIDLADSYEFDMLVMWRRKEDGRLLYATDSGCSCPTPFDSDSLETLKPATPEAIREWFDEHRKFDCARHPEPGEQEKALKVFEVTRYRIVKDGDVLG